MPGRRFGRVLPGRADGADLEFGERPQGRDVRDRGKSPVRTGPDNAHADLATKEADSGKWLSPCG